MDAIVASTSTKGITDKLELLIHTSFSTVHDNIIIVKYVGFQVSKTKYNSDS